MAPCRLVQTCKKKKIAARYAICNIVSPKNTEHLRLTVPRRVHFQSAGPLLPQFVIKYIDVDGGISDLRLPSHALCQ
jgi:hypothetical protein